MGKESGTQPPSKTGSLLDAAMSTEDARKIKIWAEAVNLPTEPTSFVHGRHGVTHFRVEAPANGPEPRKLVILSHGLGMNLHVYDGFVEPLKDAGFTVVRYDFFGCNWSIPNKAFEPYGADVFTDQLEDLMDAVCTSKDEQVKYIVGHSTGGIAATLASDRLSARGLTRLCLISPAFWAEKPFIARLADRLPSLSHWLARKGMLDGEVLKALLEANDNGYCKLPDGTHRYVQAHAHAAHNLKKIFALHPYGKGAIMMINNYLLRDALLVDWRVVAKKITNRETNPANILLVWGKEDITVPFKFASELVALAPDNITLEALDELGHDSPSENSAPIIAKMLEFFEDK